MPVLHYAPNLDPNRSTSAVGGPKGPPPLTEADLTFIGRYPDLWELIKRTYAGVIYGLAPAELLSPLMRLGWSVISAGQREFPPICIIGNAADPATRYESIMFLGHGEPILGTEGNGKRRFLIHRMIEKRTGLPINPTQRMQNGTVTEDMVAAVRAPAKEK